MRNDQRIAGDLPPGGHLQLRVTRDLGELTTHQAPRGLFGLLVGAVQARLLADDRPGSHLAAWRFSNLVKRFRQGDRLPRDVRAYLGRLVGVLPVMSALSLRHYRPGALAPEVFDRLQRLIRDGNPLGRLAPEFGGHLSDYGVVSCRVITTTGVGYLVDAWQALVNLEDMKFHGIGLGTTAAVVGDTALETELTTQYNPNSTRATGSLAEAAANIFRTVGTNTVDAAVAATEHGILSQAATGGGTLWDRTVFTVINLADGDSLESTYDMTATAGG